MGKAFGRRAALGMGCHMHNVTSLCLSQIPAQMMWHRVLRPGKAYVLTKLRVIKTRGHNYYIWTTVPSSDLIPLRPGYVRELELDISFLEADLTPLPQPTNSKDSSGQGLVRSSKVLHYVVSERNWSWRFRHRKCEPRQKEIVANWTSVLYREQSLMC